MTRIAPCTRCPLSGGCEQRKEFRARAKGLNARSVHFNCPILAAEVRVGRRIIIQTPVVGVTYSAWDGPQHEVHHVEVRATINTSRNDHSFSAVIDAGQTADAALSDDEEPETVTADQANKRRFRRRQSHIRIVRFLDEPDRKICDVGNILKPDGGCETYDLGHCVCADNRRAMAECSLCAEAHP